MSNLLRAEFLRLVSRRLTWALLVGVLVLAALTAMGTSGQARPLSEADLSEGRVMLEEYQRSLELECEAHPEACGQEGDLRPEDFLRTPLSYGDYIRGINEVAILVVALAAVLASALVGGDLRSGSISTQLTFTPRRLHLMGAKLTATTAGALLLTLAYIAAGTILGTITFLMFRGAGEVTASGEMPMMMVRLLVATLLVSLLAGSLTFGVGSSMLAIGIGTLVVLGSAMIVSIFNETIEPLLWLLPSPNLAALLNGHYEHTVWNSFDLETRRVIEYPASLFYGVVLCGAVTLGSAVAFRRRDLLR